MASESTSSLMYIYILNNNEKEEKLLNNLLPCMSRISLLFMCHSDNFSQTFLSIQLPTFIYEELHNNGQAI